MRSTGKPFIFTVLQKTDMEDPALLRLGRSSRRDRKRGSEVPQFKSRPREFENIPRREKRVHFAPTTKEEDGFMSRLRGNPVYIPVLFASLGAMLGACTCNLLYVKSPPSDAKSTVAKQDRKELTLMSAAGGGVIGVFVYWYMFGQSPKAKEDDYGDGYDDWDDGLDDGF
jgi:hypothetical protein